jgi:hypothetical protein
MRVWRPSARLFEPPPPHKQIRRATLWLKFQSWKPGFNPLFHRPAREGYLGGSLQDTYHLDWRRVARRRTLNRQMTEYFMPFLHRDIRSSVSRRPQIKSLRRCRSVPK